MATAFDTTTYPLETATRIKPSLGTKLDVLDDKSIRIRAITSINPVRISCTFCPQTESQSASFQSYLRGNATVELDITHNGYTYRGYIDGDSLGYEITDGVIAWWTFDFVGREV